MKSTFALTPKIQPQHRLKPAMLESLNILHMSSDALAAYLDEQMLSNPLLEWSDQRPVKSGDLYEKAGQFVAAEVSRNNSCGSRRQFCWNRRIRLSPKR